MEAVRDDPLFYIREHLKQRHDLAVYTVELQPGLDWAACYLPPERVPNTGAFNRQQRIWAELLELPKAKKSPTASRRSK
jgi:chromosome condensin MukBEF MukE localization factor